MVEIKSSGYVDNSLLIGKAPIKDKTTDKIQNRFYKIKGLGI